MKKIYLILGASSDLGKGLIKSIIAENQGQDITIIAHYNSNLQALENICKEYDDIDIRIVQADLTCVAEVNRLIGIVDSWGIIPTHIISLCANNFRYNRLSAWDYDTVLKDMNIQVFSFAEIVKKYIPYMVKSGYGKIIVMLTEATIGAPPKNMSEYTTVKYALLGLIKSIAMDYGDKGININGISPSMINTNFIGGIGRKVREFVAESNPKHRNLEVSDVVPTIMFLLSEQAEFVSGTNINLSGKVD